MDTAQYLDLKAVLLEAGKPVKLSFPVPRGFNVSGLWIPTVLLHYLVQPGLCAMAAMGF